MRFQTSIRDRCRNPWDSKSVGAKKCVFKKKKKIVQSQDTMSTVISKRIYTYHD